MATIQILETDYFSTWREKTNTIADASGDLADLDTTAQDSVVDAVNEVNSNVGDLTALVTTVKTSAVAAINEFHEDVFDTGGSLADLNTTDQSSIVAAINEVEGAVGSSSIGDLNNLNARFDYPTTTTNLVDAANYLEGEIGNPTIHGVADLSTAVGPVSVMTTTATSLAEAIDELDAELGNIGGLDANNTTFTSVAAAIGTSDLTNNAAFTSLCAGIGNTALTTTATTLTGAIVETFTDLGDVSSLTTTATTAVTAINELDAELGDVGGLDANNTGFTDVSAAIGTTLMTTTATTLVDAINELDAELGNIAGIDANNTGFTDVAAAIGTTLMTTTATTLVDAINEVDADVGTNATNIGTIGNLYTTATNLVGAVNEITPLKVVVTPGSEATNVVNVAIQINDYNDTALTERAGLFFYLSDDATGDSLIATAPDGGIAIGTDGVYIETVSGKAGYIVSESDGDIDLDITESGSKTAYLIVVLPTGKLVVSTALTWTA